MRAQRERRNSPNWNFCDYFLLQEELAFTYEMLGVYDEALVQYDELDALFTQFVLNSNVAGKKSGIITLILARVHFQAVSCRIMWTHVNVYHVLLH